MLALICEGEQKERTPRCWRWWKKRQQARADKDWKLADAIRDRLKELGYVVEDTPKGPKVKPI